MHELSSKTKGGIGMSTRAVKSRNVFFAMQKHSNPELYEATRKEWLVKNKEHVKVYHRTNQRKNRAIRQVKIDRTRALQHLAKHIKQKLESMGETLDKKTLARFKRVILQT